MIGAILQALGIPGFVKPFEYVNDETGERVSVTTSSRYTVLTIGRREYYFTRETGKHDGTGTMSPTDAEITRSRVDGNRRSSGAPASARGAGEGGR
jgi:hypothetical protein